jgi:cytochrome b pre-mRNA-processing protein 3
MFDRLFQRLFGKRRARRAGEALYAAALAAARDPVFFRRAAVPDSVEGRFEVLVLHIALLLARLQREGDQGAAANQELFDAMFRDLDASLREIGVGDLSMAREMRRLAEGFNGRARAYVAALESEEGGLLETALSRNLYGGKSAADANDMARYARLQSKALAERPGAEVLAGHVNFGKPSDIYSGKRQTT